MPSSEWNDYRVFLAVLRAGSLSRAARLLRLDQSTVGRRLAALEAAVGARLFDRTPDGYALTAAGESVRADVEHVEQRLLDVERQLSGGDMRIDGVVRIATTEAFASAFLIPHVAALAARYPQLAIELVTSVRPVDLARREADVAVRLGAAPKQPNLVARRMGEVSFALYAAPHYLARRARARPVKAFVGYCGEMASVPIARWADEQARGGRVVFRADTIGAVYEAVKAGIGAGALPSRLGDRDLARVRSAHPVSIPIWSVVHQDVSRAARVRAVLAFLSEVVRRPPAGGGRAAVQPAP